MNIVCADTGHGVTVVAVEVGEALEAVLLAGVKLPIDGAFLVGFQVIGVEISKEVVANDLTGHIALVAQGIGNKAQVFLQGIGAVNLADKLHRAGDDVIGEVLVVGYGDDGVPIWEEKPEGFIVKVAGLGALGDAGYNFLIVPPAAGKQQTIHIGGVAPSIQPTM